MGKETGLAQSSISTVLTGRQEPGREFLLALSRHPRINPEWLWSGDGQALVSTGNEGGRRACPIANRLFEGVPENNSACLEMTVLEPPLSKYSPTRYWIRFDETNSRVSTILCLRKGEYVLFEPDRSNWPLNLESHPCIIRTENGALQLDYITSHDGITVCLEKYRAPLPVPGAGRRRIELGRNRRSAKVPEGEMPAAETQGKDVHGQGLSDCLPQESVNAVQEQAQADADANLPPRSADPISVYSIVAVGVFYMGAFGK